MLKSLIAGFVSLSLSAAPALAQQGVVAASPETANVTEDGPLGSGGPAAQLGVGEDGIPTETLIHVGGLVFVAAAAAAVLAGGGGGGDPIVTTPTSTP